MTSPKQSPDAERYRQTIPRIKAAFARFVSRMSGIRKRRNRLTEDIAKRLEGERVERIRKSIDEQ